MSEREKVLEAYMEARRAFLEADQAYLEASQALLMALGRKGESYDAVIRRLMKEGRTMSEREKAELLRVWAYLFGLSEGFPDHVKEAEGVKA